MADETGEFAHAFLSLLLLYVAFTSNVSIPVYSVIRIGDTVVFTATLQCAVQHVDWKKLTLGWPKTRRVAYTTSLKCAALDPFTEWVVLIGFVCNVVRFEAAASR